MNFLTKLTHKNQESKNYSLNPDIKNILLKVTELKPRVVVFLGSDKADKTMAAHLIGMNSGKEAFRIDLSSVISKYIGETEKNLDKVFDVAEKTEAILFFDEADALFGKRSEVKDSHDRYANTEVTYLLKKIENYKGLIILSFNESNDKNDKFIRRFSSIINFPPKKV